MKKLFLVFIVLFFIADAYAQTYCPVNKVVSGTLAADLTTTTATDVIAATAGKGIFLSKVLITNSSATASVVNVLNNAVSKIRTLIPAGGGVYLDLNDYPLKGVVGQAWRIQPETGVSGINATYIGCLQ